MNIHAAVIGGGISGLASAFHLCQLGYHVTLIEGEEVLGGLGASFCYRGGVLERFYHCILPTDQALIRLIDAVGLGGELLWRTTNMGFMYKHKVYPLNTAFDILRFQPLPWIDRLRMGLMGVYARVNGQNPRLDYVAVDDWIRNLAGEHALNILWKPLLRAKIGDKYTGIPALWLSSRMSREKNTKQEVKGCLKHGHDSLIRALESHLRRHGADIRFKTRVETLEHDGERINLHFQSGVCETFDLVVVTSSLVQFQAMTRGLELDAKFSSLKLDYQGVINGVFLLEKPLSPFYWMPIVDSDALCQGVIEMSNLMPLERSQGLYVTYLVNYAHRNSELFQSSDDHLLDAYRRDLVSLFPDASRTIVDQFLFRAPFVEPIWPLGYRELCPPTSIIPGLLYLTCTAQVYPRVNSWNSCCEVVEGMISKLMNETSAPAQASVVG